MSGGERVVARSLIADPFHGRAELAAHLTLDRRLELGVAVEAELHGEAHDGRGADTRRFGHVGNGAERNELGVRKDGLTDAPFGRRQRIGPLAQSPLEIHGLARYSRRRELIDVVPIV